MPSPPFLRHRTFVWASGVIFAAAIALLLLAGVANRWGDAIAWSSIAAVAIVVISGRDKLPALLGFLLAVTAAVNGAGYALTLWHEETSFDEIVHAFTTFAGMAAIGWAMLGTRTGAALSAVRLFVTVVGLGFILGVLWEGIEALIGISGRPKDTLIDLLMDTGGAIAAAALTCWLRNYAARK